MQFTSEIIDLINSTPIVEEETRNVSPVVTTANMGKLLRQIASWLADNPGEVVDFPRSIFRMSPDEGMYNRMSHAYLRNTLNRVKEAQAVGRIKVTSHLNESGEDCYRISMSEGEHVKRRDVTERNLKLEARVTQARIEGYAEASREVERFNPDLSFLDGESVTPLQAAIRVQAQYKALLTDKDEQDTEE